VAAGSSSEALAVLVAGTIEVLPASKDRVSPGKASGIVSGQAEGAMSSEAYAEPAPSLKPGTLAPSTANKWTLIVVSLLILLLATPHHSRRFIEPLL
jgi:hypothetical protein